MGRGDRTPNLQAHNLLLYLLSYTHQVSNCQYVVKVAKVSSAIRVDEVVTLIEYSKLKALDTRKGVYCYKLVKDS